MFTIVVYTKRGKCTNPLISNLMKEVVQRQVECKGVFIVAETFTDL